VFILPSEAKALLELFAIRWTQLVELPIGQVSDKDDALGLVHAGLCHMA